MENKQISFLQENDDKPPKRRRRVKGLRPAHIIVLGFLGVILLGSFLLTLPISQISHEWTPFIDALFTSVSAVCVTGLIVVDTATHFSYFGQAVILLLIQIGGLGFMTLTTMIMLLLRRKITLRDRLVIREALNQDNNKGVVRLTRNILFLTFGIEGVGFLMFLPVLVKANGAIGVWQSAFLAVSAFCNAGFDVFGRTQGAFMNLTPFADNALINMTVCMLIVLGGLGFTVIMDVCKRRFNFKKISFHSKIVLSMTGALIVLGWIFFFCAEYSNAETMGSMNVGQKTLAAFFQSVTCRTAGFNTISQDGMTSASKMMSMMLMFIGASPGSTGGGIKTTTLAILILMAVAGVKSDEEIVAGRKSIGARNALKSVSVALLGLAIAFIAALILMVSEQTRIPPHLLSLENVLMETFSAFGTVGLSAGITPLLSPIGKIILMVVMFFGRVGVVTMGLLFMRRTPVDIHYPEGIVMIG